MNNVALYGVSNALQLTFTGLVEEFKVPRRRETILYKFSKDPKIAEARIEAPNGKKWKSSLELTIAKHMLGQKAVAKTIQYL